MTAGWLSKVPSEKLHVFHCVAAMKYGTTRGILWKKCLRYGCDGALRDRIKWEKFINTAMKFWNS